MRLFPIIIAGMFLAGAAAAEPARIRTAGPLLSQPVTTARAAGTVKAGAAVDILARKGFWAQVRGGSLTGWLKLDRLTVASGGSSGVAALSSGRTGSGNIVSASGGRGLDASEVASATPNNAAIAALSSTAASEAAAVKFANAGKLQSRTIAYLRGSR